MMLSHSHTTLCTVAREVSIIKHANRIRYDSSHLWTNSQKWVSTCISLAIYTFISAQNHYVTTHKNNSNNLTNKTFIPNNVQSLLYKETLEIACG